MYYVTSNHKKTGVSILITDRVEDREYFQR